MKETIEWRPVSEKPEVDTTVLIYSEAPGAWPGQGQWSGDDWFYSNWILARDVTHWAEMPKGPQQHKPEGSEK